MKSCAILGFFLAVACSKKPAPVHRTAPWLATPSASSAATPVGYDYRFTRESRVRFSLPGRKASVSGHLPVTGGSLRLNPSDLGQVSASIDVDLTQLGIDTPVPPELQLGDGSPETIALQWLELGALVPSERRAQFVNVRFELSSVEQLSTDRLEQGPTKERMAITGAAVGTVLLHGFRAPVRAPFVLTRLPATAGVPARLAIRSAGAFVLALAPHDVTARGSTGVVDALAAARAADWLGKTARIEFELLAQAQPSASK